MHEDKQINKKTMFANNTEFSIKSDKFSPTILWEMAQSPHCGPAAVEQSFPHDRRQQPSNHLLRFSAQLCSSYSSPQPSLWSPSSQPASPTSIHPAGSLSSGVHVGVQRSPAPGGWMWGRRRRQQKRNVFVSKFSYWVLAGWAMGQRAVRPKLQRQYIMPLESNQLSEIGS